MDNYRIPKTVHSIKSDYWLVSTPQNGKIALDEKLYDLWQYSDGRSLHDILNNYHSEEGTSYYIQAALACLAEAGLLERSIDKKSPKPRQVVSGSLLSVVILVYNGNEWLPDCLASLLNQTYSPLEIILVDNASEEPCQEWVNENYPQIKSS